jgi:hypothetical protein
LSIGGSGGQRQADRQHCNGSVPLRDLLGYFVCA